MSVDKFKGEILDFFVGLVVVGGVVLGLFISLLNQIFGFYFDLFDGCDVVVEFVYVLVKKGIVFFSLRRVV